MKIFIPDIGTKLKLQQPWNFTLFRESRNDQLMAAMLAPLLGREYQTGDEVYGRHYTEDEEIFGVYRPAADRVSGDFRITTAQLGTRHIVGRLDGLAVTLPKNTELSVDRVYIRKGAKDFSSLSFILRSTSHPDLLDKKGTQCFGRKGFRFWAALPEVNHMNAEVQL